MKARAGLIIFVFFTFLVVNAQEEYFTFCQRPPEWTDFVVDSTLDASGADILIVTNRPYLPDQEDFLPNDIARWRKVSYFVAMCNKDKWFLKPVADLETGLNIINDGTDILLFVHGHWKGFQGSLVRASQINTRYSIKTVLYDWPAQNRNFNSSLARVRYCGENFYNLLLGMEAYRETNFVSGQHLSLFAHSLGNYFLTHLVVNGNNQYLNNQFIDNLIINAAAVKEGEHDEVLSQIKFAENIYVALNRNDRVLRGAHLITYGKMLGNFALTPLASNAEYIHFTSVADKEHTYFAGYHSFEYEVPAIFNFYNTAMHGYDVQLNNSELFRARSNTNSYDISVPKHEAEIVHIND